MMNRYESTATEALIRALEELGEADETQVVVLTRNSNGVCAMITNCSYFSDRIGLLQSQMMWEQSGMVKTDINQ